MNKTFTSKAATFILSTIFLVIIVSFLFGDYGQNGGVPSRQDVATVNGLTVSPREFQMRLQQQVDFFAQMMGGQLTAQQIQQMGIKETVLSGIIQQKLLLSHGEEMGLALSTEEIKDEIKRLPYFLTNERFDVSKYRGLLGANGYTPTQFEEMVGQDITTRKMEQMLSLATVSEAYAKDVLSFKTQSRPVEAIRAERQELVKLVAVDDAEAQAFAAKPENQKLLQDLYQENAGTYNKPAELKARHILFRSGDKDAEALAKAEKLKGQLTTKNFGEKAKQLTEDPTGKNNGGDLGWFPKGSMVPEFEKAAEAAKVGEIVGPVKTSFGYHWILVEGKKEGTTRKLEDVKLELARTALQKRKTKELDQVMAETKGRLTQLLTSGDAKAIEAEKTRLNATVLKNTQVDRFNLSLANHALSADEGKRLFEAAPGTVLDFSTPGTVLMVKVGAAPAGNQAAEIETKLKSEVQNQSQLLARKLREELLKELHTKSKVVTNPAML